jgi:hypothetical protein
LDRMPYLAYEILAETFKCTSISQEYYSVQHSDVASYRCPGQPYDSREWRPCCRLKCFLLFVDVPSCTSASTGFVWYIAQEVHPTSAFKLTLQGPGVEPSRSVVICISIVANSVADASLLDNDAGAQAVSEFIQLLNV